MIYADGVCEATGRFGNTQIAGDFTLSADLKNYWAHWAYSREDPAFQELLSQTSYIAVQDDHEVVNDFGPLHDTRDSAPYTPGVHLLPIGLQAFLDCNPIRTKAHTLKGCTAILNPERLFFHGAPAGINYSEALDYFTFGAVEVSEVGDLTVKIINANGDIVSENQIKSLFPACLDALLHSISTGNGFCRANITACVIGLALRVPEWNYSEVKKVTEVLLRHTGLSALHNCDENDI